MAIYRTANYFVARTTLKSFVGRSCPYCGNSMKRPTRDHVRPKRAGGSLTKRNTLIVCGPCNEEKSDLMLREFYETLKTKNDPRALRIKRLLERGADPYEYMIPN